MPLSTCRVSGCPLLVGVGRDCPTHHPRGREAWPGHHGNAAARGYGHDWRRKRAQVLREEPTCPHCGGPSTTVDHKKPKAEGGTDDRSNLQGVCAEYQQRKASREGRRGQARAAIRVGGSNV